MFSRSLFIQEFRENILKVLSVGIVSESLLAKIINMVSKPVVSVCGVVPPEWCPVSGPYVPLKSLAFS